MSSWHRNMICALLAIMPVFLYAQADSVRAQVANAIPATPDQEASIKRHKDGTRIYSDTAIYQGMSIKLDLGNTALMLGLSKAKIQSYELAMNWRLKNKFFPTFEVGYALAEAEADGGKHHGQGGFGRVGLDISPLKKHPEYVDLLLIGLRVGTALQRFDLTGVQQNMLGYWEQDTSAKYDYLNCFHADAWGEIVAGCQVQVWEGLQMGWYVRYKILFTRTDKKGGPLPYYIPGFGYRDEMQWGLNYYVGWRF